MLAIVFLVLVTSAACTQAANDASERSNMLGRSCPRRKRSDDAIYPNQIVASGCASLSRDYDSAKPRHAMLLVARTDLLPIEWLERSGCLYTLSMNVSLAILNPSSLQVRVIKCRLVRVNQPFEVKRHSNESF